MKQLIEQVFYCVDCDKFVQLNPCEICYPRKKQKYYTTIQGWPKSRIATR